MTSHRRISQQDILFIATIAIWFRFSFHNWKCENPSIVIWTVIIFWKALTFGLLLSGWSGYCSNYVRLYTLTLIAHFDFIWLISHWACKFICYIWYYKGRDWFWFYMILIVMSSWLIDFIRSFVTMFYKTLIIYYAMSAWSIYEYRFHVEWQRFEVMKSCWVKFWFDLMV